MEEERAFEEKLRSLTQAFSAGLPEKLGLIEAAWARIWLDGWSAAAVNQLNHLAHALAGEAGSLGFERIARVAGNVQTELQSSAANGKSERNEELLERVEDLIKELRRAILTDRQTDVNILLDRMGAGKENPASMQEKRAERLIYLVEDDPIQASEMAAQVGYFGYTVKIFHNPSELSGAVRHKLPTAVLMDVTFPQGKMAGYDAIHALREEFPEYPPVIFVSINDRLPFRLQAVRLGGEAYFTKPVDIGGLIDVLDRVVFHEEVEPFRVLIVDDSRVQASFNERQLKKSGMLTEIVSDPEQVIESMISFNPDLVLLDVYMPGCTGMELAKIIRQMEQFISTPIVFLSAESDKEKQLAALGIGGDDFLTKPIEPEHLISAVTTRIVRYRKLRALMFCDGLTGLLNHSTTRERLSQALRLASRQNTPLAYAILDLDHFKAVNDSFGHATGDRVLKSLAHMLTQRLRHTDVVGRIGGEEFGIIFPNTNEEAAVKIMVELCDGFARIRHHAEGSEFTVTFSCGVAAYPASESAEILSKMADTAMYAAKAGGRNRVTGASEAVAANFGAAIPDGDPGGLAMTPTKKIDDDGELNPVLSRAALYTNLINHINSAILRFDRQGTITFLNRFGEAFFGYPESEIIGKNMAGTLLPEGTGRGFEIRTLVANIMERPEDYTRREVEVLRKSGESVWMDWNITPLLDENGSLTEFLCIGNDITDRKRAEADLTLTVTRLSELNRISRMMLEQEDISAILRFILKEVQSLFQACHVGISLLKEEDGILVFLADSEDGWSTGGQDGNVVRLADDPASRQVIENGTALYVEDAMHNALTNGIHQIMEMHGIQSRVVTPLVTRGKVVGTMNIDYDDAERRVTSSELELAETAGAVISDALEQNRLYTSEQRQRQYFEALLRGVPVAVVMIDMEARIVSWNPAAEELFGYKAAEVLGQNIDDTVTDETTQQEAKSYTEQTLRVDEIFRAISRRRRRDGSYAEVELMAVPLFINGVQLGSIAIYHDISELQRARREAEAANEAKSTFLATMSHEIRTPLNAVIGMTTLLMDSDLSSEQQEFAETIRNSGDSLLTIINDILDFSKIEAGRMEFEEQPFDLRECLETSLDLVAARASEKGIDLAYIMDPNVPAVVISDSTRLRQIILNLLSNSLKFTEEGEVVLCVAAEKISPEGDKAFLLNFTVRDTGIGIPAERMERLFRSFSQVDASTTRKYGGTGLGLAISKRLAELMGGRMWVESEGVPGKGTAFHFTLPVNPSSSAVPVFLNRKQPELKGKKVLIVDDNATNRYILLRQVQSWGMESKDSASPIQALEWIREKQEFDVVLLDMQMPDMDGVSLAKEIMQVYPAEYPQENSLPIVMLTSLGLKEVDASGVKFAAYLTKPIKPALLYSTLMNVFGAQPAGVRRVKEKPGFKPLTHKPAPLRILMAEDIVVNQKVALYMLERLGYRADVASNGVETLEALRRQPYDVILMDVHMPEMDGLEATRQVRSGAWMDEGDDQLKTQPYIVAMTANALQGDREKCFAAGMDDYVSKPIRVEDLTKALEWAAAAHKQVKTAAPESSKKSRKILPASGIDRSAFLKLAESMGGEDSPAVVSLIQDYLSESEQMIAGLKQAYGDQDLEKLRRNAHSIKSSSYLFGALLLAEWGKELEAAAQQASLEGAESLITKMEKETELVLASLREKMKTPL